MTDRLQLTRAHARDAPWLTEIFNEPGLNRFLWDGLPVGLATVRTQLEESDRNFERAGYGLWLVTVGPERIGFAALRPAPWRAGAVEILYGLRETAWGRGYATLAGKWVLRHAFEVSGLERVFAGVNPLNGASVRVAQKLGMRFVEEVATQVEPLRVYVASPMA